MKFLVTGSTGLVGRQVVKDLTEKNHQVYSCYHNQKPQHGNPIHLDLTNLSKPKQAQSHSASPPYSIPNTNHKTHSK